MSDVKMSSLSADTSVAGTEKLLVLDGTTTKTMTASVLAAYAIDTLAAATATGPTSGDYVLAFTGAGVEKRAAIGDVADYANALAWSEASANTAPSGGAYLLTYDGAVATKTTLDDLGTAILDGIQTDVLDISGLTAATLADTDNYLVCQSGTAKKTTGTALVSYVYAGLATYVGALTAVATVGASDKFYTVQAGTAKYATPSLLATYMKSAIALADLAWPSSSTTQPTSGNYVLLLQGSTPIKCDVDYLTELAAAGAQATVLDISGLSSATLSTSDYLLVCQSSTAKQTTLSALETKLWADYASYVVGLTAVTTTAATDKLWCYQGGSLKYVTPLELATYIATQVGTVSVSGTTPVENYVPQWDATGGDLKSGLAVVTTVRSSGAALDTALATEQGVREAIDEGIDLTALTDVSTLADADLALVYDSSASANKKATLTEWWTWIKSKFSALTAKTTPVAADSVTILDSADSSELKKVTLANLWTNYLSANAKAIQLDDLTAPSDNTDLNTSTSYHGLCPKLAGGTSTFLRADGTWASPTTTVAASGIDLDGATDIGADLADADLILVDDGAVGTNRKAAMSRVWTYVTSKIQGLSGKVEAVNADILTIQDSEASYALKELSVLAVLQAGWSYSTGQIQNLGQKATPQAADRVMLQNSNANNALVYATLSSISTVAASIIKLDELAAPTDTTTLNASSSAHGLLPKLDGNTDHYLCGDGSWSEPGVAVGWDGDIGDVDLASGADIGEALADADLILVDNGASGNMAKSAVSRIWDYVWSKVIDLGEKATGVDGDLLVIEDSASSYAAKELSLSGLWTYIVTKIQALAGKTTGVDADILTIQDSAASYGLKEFTLSAMWTYIVTKFQALSSKTTPVNADVLVTQDSAASYAHKKVTVTNLWTNRYLVDAKAIQIDDFSAASDNTDLDASASAHGLMPKTAFTKLSAIEAAADVTDSTNVDAAGAVMESDYNAYTILAATSDNTPVAVEVAQQTLVGRKTGGEIAALSVSDVKSLLGLVQQTTVADPSQTAADMIAGAGSAQGDHTLDDVTSSFDQTTLNNNFATLVAEYNKLKDDVEAQQTAITSILSRLESLGLFASS